MKKKKILGKGLTVILLSAVGLSACLDDDFEAGEIDNEVAWVSFYHSSPDVGSLDIEADDQVFTNQAFEYGDYTGYLSFYAGNREIEFVPRNQSDSLTGGNFSFQLNGYYSIFVVGEEEGLEVLMTTDDPVELQPGEFGIRFINLSPADTTMSLRFEDDEEPLFTDLEFKSVTSFVSTSAERKRVEVVLGDSTVATASTDLVDFQSGHYYTVIAKGYVTPEADDEPGLSLSVLNN